MADFTEIIQEINTNLPDNNTQSITAEKLRTTLIDLTNTIDTVQDNFESTIDTTLDNFVVDNLTTNESDKALSASQGVLIGNVIYEDIDVSSDFIVNSTYPNSVIDSDNLWNNSTNSNSLLEVNEGDIFLIKRGSNSGAFAVLNSISNIGTNDGVVDFATGFDSRWNIPLPEGTIQTITIPSGATYLYHQSTRASNPTNDIIKKRLNIKEYFKNLGKGELNTITPYFDYRGIRSNGGIFIANNYNREVYSTLRYISLDNNESFEIKVSDNRYFRVFYWDKNFNYLGASSQLTAISANNWTKVITPDNYSSAKYIKINIQKNSTITENGTADATTFVQLRGYFDETYEVFNVRPNTTNGYMNLFVSVNVTNPNSTNEETTTLQDQATYLEDYGIVWLPSTYDNIGEPTRLIIYCHGAGVQYTSSTNPNTNTEVVKNIDPTYWLAEGYAILDIDGNPFNNSDDHNQTPQSQDSYLAAYKWVINAFNIKRDGVFMGGRSMGASCALNLSRRDCPIPVIAACYNVPGGLTLSASTTSVAKKQFVTTHCGFEVPEGYTWQVGGIQTTDRQLFIDNWDKWVMNNPTLAIITNLPDAADVMDNYDYDLFGNFCDTNRLRASVNCPVKFFGCLQDATCPPSKTSEVLYRLFQRGGQRTEIRIYDCSVKYPSPSTAAHHYDTQDENLRINYISKYGESLSNISIVYIEMLEFWRRYEQ